MLNLNWIKSTKETWLPLEAVDLSNVTAFGAYIIWHGGPSPKTVRVGQGDIKSRLTAHRNDKKITAYNQRGTLFVTWAAVSKSQVDGVERYLADWLKPLVGDAFPDVTAVAVNSPWS